MKLLLSSVIPRALSCRNAHKGFILFETENVRGNLGVINRRNAHKGFILFETLKERLERADKAGRNAHKGFILFETASYKLYETAIAMS